MTSHVVMFVVFDARIPSVRTCGSKIHNIWWSYTGSIGEGCGPVFLDLQKGTKEGLVG
jgi:hypothetical protein